VARHPERHRTHRLGWLRAAVLGANDGLISTSSLILGVAAAGSGLRGVLTAGVAGLIAGAASMAAGEYVSVSSQADTESADLDRERQELASDYAAETRELAGIYIRRGLAPDLARQVAEQLMAHDALGSHARDELGLAETLTARPVEAALSSAASFAVGAMFPLIVASVVPESVLSWAVSAISVGLLAILGALAANIGGARKSIGAWRVTLWGAMAMA
jgi:vacuolar iron transporter family protein